MEPKLKTLKAYTMALLGQYHVWVKHSKYSQESDPNKHSGNQPCKYTARMKTSSLGDPAVTLPNPQHAIVLLHHGKAHQINSILTPQDTKRELKPDTCHVSGQTSVVFKMVSDAQLFDIIEETRKTWSWFGKGKSWTFQKAFTQPQFDQEKKIDRPGFSVSFTCRRSGVCKSQVLLSAFFLLSAAELLPLCEWEE